MTDDPRVEIVARVLAKEACCPGGWELYMPHGRAVLRALDTARDAEEPTPPGAPDENELLRKTLENCVAFWPSALNDDLQQRTWEEARNLMEALGIPHDVRMPVRKQLDNTEDGLGESILSDTPDENALPTDALWKTIRMVGAREDERRDFLIEMLNCESGGCRSAAASALGEMGEIGALRDRLPVEPNKFVIAGITAQLRTDTVHLTRPQQRVMEHAARRSFRVLDDPNSLPMDTLPEGAWLDHIWSSQDYEKHERYYHCIVQVRQGAPPGFPQTMKSYHETGPTPRAAFIAACEKAREG